MKIYIYQIHFPTTNKSYVGQTKNLKTTLLKRHFESNSLVCKALYKYDDWQVSVLHIVKTRNEANKIEIKEICNFNCVAPNGYNLTKGGEGNDYWKGKKNFAVSESNKRRIGRKNPEHSKFMQGKKMALGHKHSKKTKLKIKIGLIKYNLNKIEKEL